MADSTGHDVREPASVFVDRLLTLEDEARREALKAMLLEGLRLSRDARKPLVEHMLGLPWEQFKKVCVVRNGVLQELDFDTQMRLMAHHMPLLRELDPGLASRDFHYVREFRRTLAPDRRAQFDELAREAGVSDEVCR